MPGRFDDDPAPEPTAESTAESTDPTPFGSAECPGQINAVPGVAEVASVGGFVQQYQIDVDPNRLLGRAGTRELDRRRRFHRRRDTLDGTEDDLVVLKGSGFGCLYSHVVEIRYGTFSPKMFSASSVRPPHVEL